MSATSDGSTADTLPPPSFPSVIRTSGVPQDAEAFRETLHDLVGALEGTELRIQQLRWAHSSPHMTRRDLDELMRLEFEFLADTSQSLRTMLGVPRSPSRHAKYRGWVPEYHWGMNRFDPLAYENDLYEPEGRHKYVSPKLSRKPTKRQRLSGIIAKEKVASSPIDHDQSEWNPLRSSLKFSLPPTLEELPDVTIPCVMLFPDSG